MVTTLRQIREEVARGLGVRTYAEGTVPTLGTTLILADAFRQEPEGEWSDVDAYIQFQSGPLDGVVRRVTGFTQGISLQFAPATSTAIASGTQYALYKTHAPEDYNIAINDALREMGNRRVTVVATSAEVTDDRRLAVPSAVALAELVSVERSVGTTGSPWQYEPLLQGLHYRYLRSDNAEWLELLYPPTTGTVIRWRYAREATTLTADSDGTEEPILLIKALARKYLALSIGDQGAATAWAGEAERIRRDVVPTNEPSRKVVVPVIGVRY